MIPRASLLQAWLFSSHQRSISLFSRQSSLAMSARAITVATLSTSNRRQLSSTATRSRSLVGFSIARSRRHGQRTLPLGSLTDPPSPSRPRLEIMTTYRLSTLPPTSLSASTRMTPPLVVEVMYAHQFSYKQAEDRYQQYFRAKDSGVKVVICVRLYYASGIDRCQKDSRKPGTLYHQRLDDGSAWYYSNDDALGTIIAGDGKHRHLHFRSVPESASAFAHSSTVYIFPHSPLESLLIGHIGTLAAMHRSVFLLPVS